MGDSTKDALKKARDSLGKMDESYRKLQETGSGAVPQSYASKRVQETYPVPSAPSMEELQQGFREADERIRRSVEEGEVEERPPSRYAERWKSAGDQ